MENWEDWLKSFQNYVDISECKTEEGSMHFSFPLVLKIIYATSVLHQYCPSKSKRKKMVINDAEEGGCLLWLFTPPIRIMAVIEFRKIEYGYFHPQPVMTVSYRKRWVSWNTSAHLIIVKDLILDLADAQVS